MTVNIWTKTENSLQFATFSELLYNDNDNDDEQDNGNDGDDDDVDNNSVIYPRQYL